jgi:hypothetical protein
LRCAHAVEFDAKRRIVGRLLDSRIRNARHAGDLTQELIRIDVIGVEVGADNLHVDRRR